jgi:hypothetical protein
MAKPKKETEQKELKTEEQKGENKNIIVDHCIIKEDK